MYCCAETAGNRREKGRPAARPALAPARRRRSAPVRSPPARTSAVATRSGRCIAGERSRPKGGDTRDCRRAGGQDRGRTATSGRAATWERSTEFRRRESRMCVPQAWSKSREKAAVFRGREVAVELLAECGDHRQASMRKRPFSMICRPSTQMSNCVPTTSMWVPEYQFAPVCSP